MGIGGVAITAAIGTEMVGAVAVGGIVVTVGMAITGVAVAIGTVAVVDTVIGMVGAKTIATNEYDAAKEGRLLGAPLAFELIRTHRRQRKVSNDI